MKRIYNFIAILLAFCSVGEAVAQGAKAMKPKIMVVPDNNWMDTNGFLKEEDVQGNKVFVPDYTSAFVKNVEMKNVVAEVSNEMSKTGYNMTSLERNLSGLNERSARNATRTYRRTGGAKAAQSSYDELLQQANADIIFDLWYAKEKSGGDPVIHFRVTGIDAFSFKQIAHTEGWSPAMAAAPVSQLLAQQVDKTMKPFIQELEDYFLKMQENNAREIIFEMYAQEDAFDNGLEDGLETRIEGKPLNRIVRDWLNSEAKGYSVEHETEDEIVYNQLLMPFFDKENKPQSTKDFIYGLEDLLQTKYKIDCKTTAPNPGTVIMDVIGKKQ
jgi:hypothetical protein